MVGHYAAEGIITNRPRANSSIDDCRLPVLRPFTGGKRGREKKKKKKETGCNKM